MNDEGQKQQAQVCFAPSKIHLYVLSLLMTGHLKTFGPSFETEPGACDPEPSPPPHPGSSHCSDI